MRVLFDTSKLRKQIEDNPLAAMAVGSTMLLAVSRLLRESTARKRAKIWEKEVDRRARQLRKK